MTFKDFRAKLLYAIFFTKLITICLIVFIHMTDGFSADQTKNLLFLVSPLFAGNIIIGLKYYLNNRISNPNDDYKVPNPVIWLAFTIIFVCLIFIVVSLLDEARDDIAFETLKGKMLWIEGLFLVYLGTIVKGVFNVRTTT